VGSGGRSKTIPKMAAARGIRRATTRKERPTSDVSHLGGGSEPDISITPPADSGGDRHSRGEQCKGDAALASLAGAPRRRRWCSR
jgi:hypothetical protein